MTYGAARCRADAAGHSGMMVQKGWWKSGSNALWQRAGNDPGAMVNTDGGCGEDGESVDLVTVSTFLSRVSFSKESKLLQI